jgi:hypothetical protein
MKAQPADRTAKRISAQEWFARFGALDLLARHQKPAQPQMSAPADRIAVRA